MKCINIDEYIYYMYYLIYNISFLQYKIYIYIDKLNPHYIHKIRTIIIRIWHEYILMIIYDISIKHRNILHIIFS